MYPGQVLSGVNGANYPSAMRGIGADPPATTTTTDSKGTGIWGWVTANATYVGIGVGVLLLILLWFFWPKKKTRKRTSGVKGVGRTKRRPATRKRRRKKKVAGATAPAPSLGRARPTRPYKRCYDTQLITSDCKFKAAKERATKRAKAKPEPKTTKRAATNKAVTSRTRRKS